MKYDMRLLVDIAEVSGDGADACSRSFLLDLGGGDPGFFFFQQV